MLWFFIIILSLTCLVQYVYIKKIKARIKQHVTVLQDIYENENLDRRLLTSEKTVTSELVYKINDIVIKDKNRFTELEKAEKTYRKLITSLSHDVRTPLATLMGYLEVLQNGRISPKEREDFIKTAYTKALNLNEYINTLFDWIKLESGEWVYHVEPTDICEQTRRVLANWIIKLEKEQIKFKFDIPEEKCVVQLDTIVYERIVNNIVANVIGHSNADCLTVSLKCDGGKAILTLNDNGKGIPETELPFIFDRLYKCDRARSENSNGLGLAIAKELTGKLNGDIKAESIFGKGTTFTVSLPIA